MSQLFFDFFAEVKSEARESDFIISQENELVYSALRNFCSQKDFSSSNLQSVVIQGAKSSGKTELLRKILTEFSAEFLQKDDLVAVNLLQLFSANHFYILEDIDCIDDDNLLLHVINSAAEAKAFLILSTTSLQEFSLKDLVSRLKNITILTIKNPESDLMKMLMVKELAKLQITLKGEFIDNIVKNITRNYQAIFMAVKFLEMELASVGKGVDDELVKKVIKFINA